MRNPWLDIPLADYEAHMALPGVGQAQLLSDLLAGALSAHRPRSLAVLGCAGGNGFERIPPGEVARIVGVDVNPVFVEAARKRFARRLPGLELIAGDVQRDRFDFPPVEMVFAGLLFEYVDVPTVLRRIRSMLIAGGTLVAVLQLPSAAGTVTPSPYRCLSALSEVLSLVSPDVFQEYAAGCGFDPLESHLVTATGGKRFHVQGFRNRA